MEAKWRLALQQEEEDWNLVSQQRTGPSNSPTAIPPDRGANTLILQFTTASNPYTLLADSKAEPRPFRTWFVAGPATETVLEMASMEPAAVQRPTRPFFSRIPGQIPEPSHRKSPYHLKPQWKTLKVHTAPYVQDLFSHQQIHPTRTSPARYLSTASTHNYKTSQ